MTKYQALHSHDIQLCIQVCHKQTDIYIFHQVNTTLFYSYKWAWSHNPLYVDFLFKRTEQVVFSAARNFRASQNQLARQSRGLFSKVAKIWKKVEIINSLKCMKESSR